MLIVFQCISSGVVKCSGKKKLKKVILKIFFRTSKRCKSVVHKFGRTSFITLVFPVPVVKV